MRQSIYEWTPDTMKVDLATSDPIDLPLSWNGNTDLSPLHGQWVRPKFDIDKTDLFAVRF